MTSNVASDLPRDLSSSLRTVLGSDVSSSSSSELSSGRTSESMIALAGSSPPERYAAPIIASKVSARIFVLV